MCIGIVRALVPYQSLELRVQARCDLMQFYYVDELVIMTKYNDILISLRTLLEISHQSEVSVKEQVYDILPLKSPIKAPQGILLLYECWG